MASLWADAMLMSQSPKGTIWVATADSLIPRHSRLDSGREDLTLERGHASFDSREMNYYIHGGRNIVEVRGVLSAGWWRLQPP